MVAGANDETIDRDVEAVEHPNITAVLRGPANCDDSRSQASSGCKIFDDQLT